jgi:hypothetical protein
LFAAIIFFTGAGLLDLDVDAPDVRGLAMLDIVETVVVLPDRRWARDGGIILLACLFGESSSRGRDKGKFPRSPEVGSKTLSATGSGLRVIMGSPRASDRSKILLRLPWPGSARSVASSLWLSWVSGSKVKSSRRISTISR